VQSCFSAIEKQGRSAEDSVFRRSVSKRMQAYSTGAPTVRLHHHMHLMASDVGVVPEEWFQRLNHSCRLVPSRACRSLVTITPTTSYLFLFVIVPICACCFVWLQEPGFNRTFYIKFGVPGLLSLAPCSSNATTTGCAAVAYDSKVCPSE
jgi:hypothetical protein